MDDDKLNNAKCPDGRVLMFQLTNMIGNANLENIRAFGVHIDNGEPFLELIQNLLLFIHEHIWMPCSVKMPCEKDGKVLISMPNGEVRTGTHSEYSGGQWFIGDMMGIGCDDPIAWMPMPEPYKG